MIDTIERHYLGILGRVCAGQDVRMANIEDVKRGTLPYTTSLCYGARNIHGEGDFQMKTVGIMLAALVIVGCAGGGNMKVKKATQDSIAQKIIEGKTTQQEVHDMFGTPEISFTETGTLTWKYQYAKSRQSCLNFVPFMAFFRVKAQVTLKVLIIYFDKKKVVTRYFLTESTSEQKGSVLFN